MLAKRYKITSRPPSVVGVRVANPRQNRVQIYCVVRTTWSMCRATRRLRTETSIFRNDCRDRNDDRRRRVHAETINRTRPVFNPLSLSGPVRSRNPFRRGPDKYRPIRLFRGSRVRHFRRCVRTFCPTRGGCAIRLLPN